MKQKTKNRWVAAAVIIGIFFLFQIAIFSKVRAGDLVIIGSKDVPIDSLSRDEIKSIFLGEKVKWDKGGEITFVLLSTEVHEEFLKKYLESNSLQYRQYWKKMIFTGRAKSPKSFDSTEKLIEFISGTSGAVGYIPSEAQNDKVKTISVK